MSDPVLFPTLISKIKWLGYELPLNVQYFKIRCKVLSFAWQDSCDMSCVGHKTNRFHLWRHLWTCDNRQRDALGQWWIDCSDSHNFQMQNDLDFV